MGSGTDGRGQKPRKSPKSAYDSRQTPDGNKNTWSGGWRRRRRRRRRRMKGREKRRRRIIIAPKEEEGREREL